MFKRNGGRRITNLPEVMEALLKIGWNPEEVHLEGMSFQTQVQKIANASVLIGTHGNGIGNAAWLPDNSMVIELHQYGEGKIYMYLCLYNIIYIYIYIL